MGGRSKGWFGLVWGDLKECPLPYPYLTQTPTRDSKPGGGALPVADRVWLGLGLDKVWEFGAFFKIAPYSWFGTVGT
jgi:hypothetical protein